MSIPDPMWPSRSLRCNPFLRDYFAEKDCQNEAQASDPDQNIFSPSDNLISAENSFSCPQEPNSNHNEKEREFYRDSIGSYKVEARQPILHSHSPNDLGAKVMERAMDPFEDVWDVGRMARVLILANELQKDEEIRAQRKEKQQQNKESNSSVKQKVWEYATDPLGDFGSVDPGRIKRVEALAKAIPKENPLIQTELKHSDLLLNGKTKNKPKPFQSESDVRDIIEHHQEKIGLVKQGIEKVEKFIEKHIPKADPKQFTGKVSQQILQAQNEIHEQKIQNFENLIRGINDYVVWQCDGLLSAIPGLNHSSKEFYDNHKMGKKGEGLESSFYYWAGSATGITSELLLFKGGPTTVNYGKTALQKAGNALIKAGVKGAIYTKLLTGGIGEGITPFLPRGFGGTTIIGKGGSGGLLKQFSEATLFKAAETVSQVIKNSPEMLKKAPELASFLQRPITDARNFIQGLFALTKTPINSHAFKDLTKQVSVLSEMDSVVNHAIGEIAKGAAAAEAIFSDFSRILDALDDSSKGIQEYAEFARRQGVRQFITDMDCPKEAVSNVMKKLPKGADFTKETVDKIVKNILIAEDNIRYCNKYVKDPWIREKLQELLMPLQKHHVFTNKCKEKDWTRNFKKIFDQYGIDINKHWNLILIPHLPQAHDDKYHKWCYDILVAAHKKAQSVKGLTLDHQKDLLLKIIEEKLIIPIRENPLLPMKKWYKFWQNDKSQADSMKSSSIKDETVTMQ